MKQFLATVAVACLCVTQARAASDVKLHGKFPDGATISVHCHTKGATIVGIGKIVGTAGREEHLHIKSGTYGNGVADLQGHVRPAQTKSRGHGEPFTIHAVAATGEITIVVTGPGGKTTTHVATGTVVLK